MEQGLEIHLTRLSNTHHRLRLVRSDGSSESCQLETRSCLFHDLVHLAVETEAGLWGGFYGQVARGSTRFALAELESTEHPAGELAITESVVGPVQGWLRREDRPEPQMFVSTLRVYLESTVGACPSWLTVEFAIAVAERIRKLEGRWRGVSFGETLVLDFPLSADRE